MSSTSAYFVMTRAIPREVVRKIAQPLANYWMRHRETCAFGSSSVSLAGLPEMEIVVQPLLKSARFMIGKGCVYLPEQSIIGVQSPSGRFAESMHQDAPLFDGFDGVTFWMPLGERVGMYDPSLRIATKRVRKPLPCPGIYDGPTERLEYLWEGDAAVIWPLTPHATDIPAGASQTQITLDIRCGRPN